MRSPVGHSQAGQYEYHQREAGQLSDGTQVARWSWAVGRVPNGRGKGSEWGGKDGGMLGGTQAQIGPEHQGQLGDSRGSLPEGLPLTLIVPPDERRSSPSMHPHAPAWRPVLFPNLSENIDMPPWGTI